MLAVHGSAREGQSAYNTDLSSKPKARNRDFGTPMPSPKTQAPLTRLRQRSSLAAEHWRNRLAHVDALPQLSLLGLLTGVLAGSLILAFRLVVEFPLAEWLPEQGENFEGLAPQWRFFLPLTGALLLGLILHQLPAAHRETGVGHVLDRLHNHQGPLPLHNLLTQFIGGALALLSGQSAGREGPAVHLGAASASQLGLWLKLPNNSLRPLVACGVAAAIAASFNTPMAGVIFAMEVVLMEYTIVGFIPVILAAVAGTALTQLVFGPDIVFTEGISPAIDLFELPVMAGLGLLVALAAVAYIRLHSTSAHLSRRWPLPARFALAGLIGALGGLWVPQIMGMGYDTITSAMAGELSWPLLLAVLIAKLVVTALIIGLGIPGGIIGPTLVMGACLGGVAGSAALLLPMTVSDAGVYVILGMAAMMAAVLNAPLAAMVAILELTYNPGIIFPGLLVVVMACLTSRWLFRCDSLFAVLLEQEGKSNRPKLMQQLLSRTGVRGLLNRNFLPAQARINSVEARSLLKSNPTWILIQEPKLLLRPADLVQYLEREEAESQTTGTTIDLLEIPGQRLEMAEIEPGASLYQAWQTLKKAQVDALYVMAPTGSIGGIITREQIETYYQV